MPQNNAVGDHQASTSPPLIQFTDGGIRVNFAGFHAQAGLGGLLGGSQAGGGLHASAGTPWGANAAAGLGGSLDGNNPTARGGLYARARFSEGGPMAAAGLGGAVGGDGSEPPVKGGLYAGASMGSEPVNAESTTNTGTTGPVYNNPNRGRTNIQIISRKKAPSHQQSRELTGKTDSSSEKEVPAVKVVGKTNTSDAAPVIGSATAQTDTAPAPPPAPSAPAVSQLNKVKAIGRTVSIEPVSRVPPLPGQFNDVVPTILTKEVTVLHPKRLHRKRLWGPRKQVIYTSVPVEVVHDSADGHSASISRRHAQGFINNPLEERQKGKDQNGNNGNYDDIFNIPVSTLNAVNRLLNNNSG
ncbi:uncharacterized protein LOC144476591 isoform X2 [Augochlora pura]